MSIPRDAARRIRGTLARVTRRVLRRRMDQVFGEIYRTGHWGLEGSRSGTGSSLDQTAELRARLPELVRSLGVKSLLDIPCGDYFWMREVDLGLERYIGADVVEPLVKKLQADHGDGRRSFVRLDLTHEELPRVDMILARDVLVHLSNRDACRALHNIRRSGATWLATTTFRDRTENVDIETGNWRPLNLQAPPFGLPAPHRLIDERCTEGGGAYVDKCLGVWRIAEL